MELIAVLGQMDWDIFVAVIVGMGFTVIVKVLVGPVQETPLNVNIGVTTIEAVRTVFPVLIAVNDGILPMPLAANPIVARLFVQVYDVPVPLKVTGAVFEPLHKGWLLG